jgi:hypothetical protein
MALKGLDKSVLNFGRDALVAYAPYLAKQLVQRYNRMVLGGEIDRARAAIKQEFTRNRVLAQKIYAKHKCDMDPEIAALYESFAKEE